MLAIQIEIARAKPGADLSRPDSWTPGRVVAHLGTVDATGEDATFVLDGIATPAIPGLYVFTATSAGDREVLAQLKVL
jgi:hypothetical protein